MIEAPIIYNGLTLNDQSKRSLLVSPFYWYRVTSVDGLYGNDVRYESHNIPHDDGERSGDVFYTGKLLTISGQIIARDYTTLRVAVRAMQQAFWDLDQHDLMFTLWGEGQLKLTCRVSQPLIIVEEQTDELPNRRFSVALRADDPKTRTVAGSTVYPTFQT